MGAGSITSNVKSDKTLVVVKDVYDTKEEIENALNELIDSAKYGIVLRAKGIVCGEDGEWIHFDYVPGEPDVRTGSAGITGRICVIGSKISEDKISELFRI